MTSVLWWLIGWGLGLLVGGWGTAIWCRRTKQTAMAQDSNLRLMSRRLAHEIRNPLNAMNLHVQLLEEELAELDTPPVTTQRRILRLQGEIKRLDRIVTQYQNYARLPEPERADCDVNGLIRDLLVFLEPEIQHHGIELDSQLEPLPPIQADPRQLQQALLNLILNANQAMPDGGRLTIHAHADASTVRIDISDTGAGIPEEHQRQIFEPFYSTKDEGTGIGLPLAQHVVEAHGGRISFATQAGRGTTFSVQLPVVS